MGSLAKRDPFKSLSWSRLLDDFDFPAMSQRGLKVRETDNAIIAEAVVAGVDSNDVDIHIEDGVLTIKAENTITEGDGGDYEQSSYQYYYSVAMSGGQWDQAEADIENGILTITIPKAESARPRKISVKSKSKKK